VIINQGIKSEWFDIIANSVQQAPYYSLLGIELREVGSGWAILEVIPARQHTNPMDLVHGGLIMSLGDAAMGNAIRSQGIKAVTASMNIEFIRPADLGTKLVERREISESGTYQVFDHEV